MQFHLRCIKMSSIEDKKRIVTGTKVSAIANIFQPKNLDGYLNTPRTIVKDSLRESDNIKDSPSVTVVRTESHVARFNNARALFEKLGEDSKNQLVDKINKPTYLHGMHSRSSSATSGSICMSPTRSPRQQSPSPEARENLSNWSSSVPTLNAEHHFENGHLHASKRMSRRQLDMNKGKKCEKENRVDEKSQTFAKLDRKLNSKELIEKQKNWTSHFPKTRSNRCNLDPKLVDKITQNQSIDKNGENDQPLDNQFVTSYMKDSKWQGNAINSPLSMSSSFQSDKSLNGSSPPPLPARNASSGIGTTMVQSAINVSPVSNIPGRFVTTSYNKDISTSPEEPEYAEIYKLKQDKTFENLSQDRFELNEDNDIPEYAVVQKHPSKKNSDFVKPVKHGEGKACNSEIRPGISNNFVVSEGSLPPIDRTQSDVSNSTADQFNEIQNILNNTESKRLKWESRECPDRTKLQDKFIGNRDCNSFQLNNHLTNQDANDYTSSTECSPNWDSSYECYQKESLEIQKLGKNIEFEGGSPKKGSDSTSLSMSPSSPSADSKEEKAEKESSEKIQFGNRGICTENDKQLNLYGEKFSDDDVNEDFQFIDSNVTTVIRRTHTRPEPLNQYPIKNNVQQNTNSNAKKLQSSIVACTDGDYETLDLSKWTDSSYYKLECDITTKSDHCMNLNKLKNSNVQLNSSQTNKKNLDVKIVRSDNNLYSNDTSDQQSFQFDKNSLASEIFSKTHAEIEVIPYMEINTKAAVFFKDSSMSQDATWEAEKQKSDKILELGRTDSIENDFIRNDFGLIKKSLDKTSPDTLIQDSIEQQDILNGIFEKKEHTLGSVEELLPTIFNATNNLKNYESSMQSVIHIMPTEIQPSATENSLKKNLFEREPRDLDGENKNASESLSDNLVGPATFSIASCNEYSLSHRSRSDLTIDSMTESFISSVSGSESNILGSFNSLNDTNDTTHGSETEPDETFVPTPGKIVLIENGVHYFEDGHFWMEVAGIPDSDEDEPVLSVGKIPFKKNAKIRFDSGPIKVYSTHSIHEYDRRNEDVDPVAASAEYELEKRVEKMNVFPVELEKGPDGLGLSIIGMGVGADAGLEKLGIFVKTITEKGAASREGRIQVNDQIVEVDGKSLVGVTQAYAASVLRNTSGLVRFVIGREKDPQNSEVAMLIKQSLKADKEREMQQIQMNVNRRLNFTDTSSEGRLNKDECLQNEIPSLQGIISSPAMSSCSEGEPRHSSIDNLTSTNRNRSPIISSSLPASLPAAHNDIDNLRTLLQELLELESSGATSEEYAMKLRESSLILHETERSLTAARKDLMVAQEMLQQAAIQSTNFQHKYFRARKTARELRTDITARDEFYQQLLQEKDTEYNALVKNLKDRVITLEVELTEIQKKFGLPVRLPYDSATKIVTPQMRRHQLPPPPFTASCQLSDTETSDLSSPDDGDKTATVERKLPIPIPVKEELDRAIPAHCLLDNSAGKSKAELATRGGLANRQLPKRSGGLSNSSSDCGLDESEDNTDDDLSKEQDVSQGSSLKSNSELGSKQSIFSSYSSSSSVSVSKSKLSMDSLTTSLRQHSTISSQVRAMTEQSWQSSQKGFAEQLKQKLAEREKRLGNGSLMDSSGDYGDLNLPSCDDPTFVAQHLVEEIRQAVHEVNQSDVKKFHMSMNSIKTTPWHPNGSPSSLSSGGSISPPVSDSLLKSGSSGDLRYLNNLAPSWQNVGVCNWTKDHVHQWMVDIGLQRFALLFIEASISGPDVLRFDTREIKSFGITGEDKVHFKKKLKEIRILSERERKEQKEMDRMKRKAAKFSKKK